VAGKKFDILPLALESLLSILLLIMDKMEQFQANSFIHITHTSHKHDLHRPKEKEASFAEIIIIQGRIETLYSHSLYFSLNNSHTSIGLSISSVPSTVIHITSIFCTASCCS
jgi:hypothetical protein